MRKLTTAFVAGALACATLICATLICANTPAFADSYVNEARSACGVSASNVLEVTAGDADDAVSKLNEAGCKASASNPFIVHLPNGAYNMQRKVVVQKDVVLAADDGATINLKAASPNGRVEMYGSIYGGKFVGMTDTRVILLNSDYSGINGTIRHTVVTNRKKKGCYGIVAYTECKNAKILNNNVSNCWSDINVFFGGHAENISGNTTFNNSEAGINIVRANVGSITGNTIRNNGKHGISTDIEAKGAGPAHCYINQVSNNTFTNNGKKGLYIEDYCRALKVAGNTFVGNENGICVEAHGTAKNVANNTFTKTKSASIVSTGSKALVVLGASNKILNSKDHGITINRKGTVKITGKGNIIKGSAKNGIQLVGGATLTITGKNTVISSNKIGISISKGKATVKNTKFKSNKKFGVYIAHGQKFKQSKTSLSKSGSAKGNRLYKA